MMKKLVPALTLVLLAQTAAASDVEELSSMLHHFLAHSHTKAAHESFWADDLVYTSSAGLRFGKADILAGYDEAEEAEPAQASDAELPTVYTGEEVDVRVYGDAAVVAFKLVGTPTNEDAENDVLYYYNTGTFLRRDGIWQVVAWQATKIPPQ
ncbi:MAG: nuclear transport factor 2 family protein [Gammaproteobacteria bacterium]|nr:nuclear transport factor 2 family protein [Gammaproteobacteria bacterium]MDH5620082.1 nuclear transport factor 2 family protein [Gammaproteobacteria bacterium]